MKTHWLWDRRMTPKQAKRILGNPTDPQFAPLSALLLARQNIPREVFKSGLKPIHFCQYWHQIKRLMRRDQWNNPRIIFWQAVHEKLREKYQKKGVDVSLKLRTSKPMDEFCKMTGEKIKVIRKQLHWTQEKLATRLGVSQQMISRIEAGKENLSLLTLKQIARGLGIKIDIQMKLIE